MVILYHQVPSFIFNFKFLIFFFFGLEWNRKIFQRNQQEDSTTKNNNNRTKKTFDDDFDF
jgi:hypothetical protein